MKTRIGDDLLGADQWQALQVLGMMHDFEVNYLAYPLTYISNKLTTENKVISGVRRIPAHSSRSMTEHRSTVQSGVRIRSTITKNPYGTINCQSTMKWFSWFSMGPTLHRMESTSVLLET